MKIKFDSDSSSNSLILGIAEEFDIDRDINFDENSKTLIRQVVQLHDFLGKEGQKICITIGHQNFKHVTFIGIGKLADFNLLSAIKFGGKVIASLKNSKISSTSVGLENRLIGDCAEKFAHIALGLLLRNYSFDKYKSAEKLKEKVNIENVELNCPHFKDAEDIFIKSLKPMAEAIEFSRNLVSEPPNVIYPASFAEEAKKELSPFGVKIEILGEKEMQDLGMNALLGVGQGSSKESKMLVMQYQGSAQEEQPLAFIGKGVTFDTGGISIKPSANMEDMKYDMAGAATVTGLMRALASRKAKVNVIAIAGLVENMPDGNAQRPADVVKSMSGQTIEVINTDAEGRLVLSDCLWYCQNRFKPKFMIDLATLTGAIIISLGNHRAGLFSNDEDLVQKLTEAAKITEEKLWNLPLGDEYDKMIDSPIADIRNISTGKGAGSITAAQFLKRFVNDIPWAHLDIAGVAWAEKDSDINPQGATAFGIRLLNEFVKSYER